MWKGRAEVRRCLETQALQGSTACWGLPLPSAQLPCPGDCSDASPRLPGPPTPPHSRSPGSLLSPLPPRPLGVLCPPGPRVSPVSRTCPFLVLPAPDECSTSLPLSQGLPSPLLRCPSQRLLDRVVRRYAEVPDAGSIFMDHFTDRDKLRLLYTLAVNAHPILLQVRSDPRKAPPGMGLKSNSEGASPGLSSLPLFCTPWGHQPMLVLLWHSLNTHWLLQWESAVVAVEGRGVRTQGWGGGLRNKSQWSPSLPEAALKGFVKEGNFDLYLKDH